MIDAQRAFRRLFEQHALGPRYVGSAGHRAAHGLLHEWLSGADELSVQRFAEPFFGSPTECRNFRARFSGKREGRVLLGTHFDTRPFADRDPDEGRRRDPVPGANDGASGTALLAELAVELAERRDRPSVDIVLFDAEDWHEIDGKEVSLGARRFVAELDEADRPDAAIIVDMVAGRDLMLDFDLSVEQHEPSFALAESIFRSGRRLGLSAFGLHKEEPFKWIGCDHSPFIVAGIPSAILIDIDYPPWHTVEDRPAACDVASLQQMAVLLEALLFAANGDHLLPRLPSSL